MSASRQLAPFFAVAVVAGLLIVGASACDNVNPRAPRDLTVAAATDSTVLLSWAEPAEGTPDAYLIYFRPVNDSLFALVAETTAQRFEHQPLGRTGRYRVAARFGSTSYAAEHEPSTVPVGSGLVAVAELDAQGNSGYGWDRSSGRGRTFSMRRSESSSGVDFYVTDFKPAALPELPYAVASPTMGPADAAGVVPVAPWRRTRFTDPLDDEHAPLPPAAMPVYYNYSDISRLPCCIGCFTADSHYALIKVLQVDSTNRSARLQTWFSPIKGLRLLSH